MPMHQLWEGDVLPPLWGTYLEPLETKLEDSMELKGRHPRKGKTPLRYKSPFAGIRWLWETWLHLWLFFPVR